MFGYFLACFIVLAPLSALPVVPVTRIPSTNSPPPVRIYHMMVYNNVTNMLIIFGGNQDVNTIFNDVWEYDLTRNLYANLVPTNDVSPGKNY